MNFIFDLIPKQGKPVHFGDRIGAPSRAAKANRMMAMPARDLASWAVLKRSMYKNMKRHPPSLSLFVVYVPSAVAFACNVPVFRYALERWPADLYEVVDCCTTAS